MCVGYILLCIVSLFPFTGVEICHSSCKWKQVCLKYCKSTHCSLGVDCESKWFLITNFPWLLNKYRNPSVWVIALYKAYVVRRMRGERLSSDLDACKAPATLGGQQKSRVVHFFSQEARSGRFHWLRPETVSVPWKSCDLSQVTWRLAGICCNSCNGLGVPPYRPAAQCFADYAQ